MLKFLPLLSKKEENDNISPFSTFYKQPQVAKLKILNQTLSPRLQYSPRWCKQANNEKKITLVSVTPLKVQKEIKQFIIGSPREKSPTKIEESHLIWTLKQRSSKHKISSHFGKPLEFLDLKIGNGNSNMTGYHQNLRRNSQFACNSRQSK